jgi:hypothetical protein
VSPLKESKSKQPEAVSEGREMSQKPLFALLLGKEEWVLLKSKIKTRSC